MATTRITEKISELVRSQLPEFVRTDYETFVLFLEYYYKFLEQDQGALEIVQNARQYNDIDKTVESFIQYFLQTYAKNIPFNVLVDKRFLVKKISDLYASKGSSLSFDTVFRSLFNTGVITRHPYDYVLRPSDGRWGNKLSIHTRLISGSTSDIKDRVITLLKNNIQYTAEILQVKPLPNNLNEIFLKPTTTAPFEIGDTVTISSAEGVIYTGVVEPTTVNYIVGTPGVGFREGQVFNVNVEGALDTIVRITKVNSAGGIEQLKFLNYGYNYPNTDITVVVKKDLTVTSRVQGFATRSGGFSETVAISKPQSPTDPNRYFLSDYLSEDFVGELLDLYSTTQAATPGTIVTTVSDPDDAIITFNMGAVARYPGQYTSTQGFLSEPDVRLQDSKLYQPFAYQLETEIDSKIFYDIVKKLVHPAGTNMYVNRVLAATANLQTRITVETRKNVYSQFNETITLLEETIIKNVGKLLQDSTNSLVDTTTKSTTKVLSDSQTLVDNGVTFSFTKTIDDDVATQDSLTYELNLLLADSVGVVEEITNIGFEYARTFDSNTNITDAFESLDTTKPFSDSAPVTDTADVVLELEPKSDTVDTQDTLTSEFATDKDDSVTLTEAQVISFTKAINNTDSIVTIEDNGDVILVNFAEEGYFSEVYAGTSTPL